MESLHLRGTILPDDVVRDVFVTAGGLISFDGAAMDARTVAEGAVLVPGLADVHCHLAMASPAEHDATPEEAVRASARAEAKAGVLAVREPGSPAPRAALGLGTKDGYPRTITAGRFVASPGGYVPGFAHEVAPEHLADAVEEQVRTSGEWAKVIGDWLAPDGRHRQNFPADALAAAAARVHAAGGRIAIHAGLTETIQDAIDAGFDSIEHGLSAGESIAGAMAAAGVTLVPTMLAMQRVPEFMVQLGVPRDHVESWAKVVHRQPEGVREVWEAGVTVLAGTDAGMVPHGLIAEEIQMLLRAGLDPMAALGAGSWKAREFLGLPGIEEGAPADIVAFARDPREDPSVLSEPALAILDGRTLFGA